MIFEAIKSGNSKEIGVVFYDKITGHEIKRIPFPEEERIGRFYRMSVDSLLPEKDYLYQIYEDELRHPDPKGREFFAAKKYGEPKSPEDLYTVIPKGGFDWKDTKNPRIAYEDSFIYCIHVRGFTKHASSGVKARGTFAGVTEKIPYLKKIGVTTLEFQPIYEFIERRNERIGGTTAQESQQRLNYWGYTEGYYYAPKSDYAMESPVQELKTMVRQLHENGMEVILQFYFDKDFRLITIPEILKFWVSEYHIDGFHLIGEDLPSEMIASDPAFSETKIWYYHMDADKIYGRQNPPEVKTLGILQDDYMYDCRRFLKGEEGCIPAIMYQMHTVPEKVGRIHYLTTYWGFGLMDMVSYDFKHNEQNGEENHDGTDYNCSWNCGEEGPTRKKKIAKLRLTQLKNAYFLLFFSQSTPRIFMGDEFGNSQKGNNNPYCQDNLITWLDWKLVEKNKELTDAFLEISRFRREHRILHPVHEATMMDTISCGYPDLSFHGKTAWRPEMESFSRQLGVMYCGFYENAQAPFYYLAINMHWEIHELGLPRLPKGSKWRIRYYTCENTPDLPEKQELVKVPPKTIILLESYKFRGDDKNEDDKDMETFQDDNAS